MRLALFDLDHTLIPFDSGMAWLRFLADRERTTPEVVARYLDVCLRYVRSEADVRTVQRALLAPMAEIARADLRAWTAEFAATVPASLEPSARALVKRHLDAGDRCVLVTATTRFIAEVYAQAFGIGETLASEALADSHGQLTGELAGPPCAGAQKLAKLQSWLQLEGLALASFERSFFYSDSAGDLPLLEAVSEPVAVRPEPRLRQVAAERGWAIV
ncbi:MAG TPA: HAD-IB family hydrolase [Methylibium sp.]|uniref:HAD family hydrolase n=1 Tax=Methylibium sp. TaxID=2067992 RepID=UPI002DBBD809|nr:HAD-IB family hydrolase [Methylibium sp.]HEU4459788.1 HAD-IB family hydrolase [Methylibium sp.]